MYRLDTEKLDAGRTLAVVDAAMDRLGQRLSPEKQMEVIALAIRKCEMSEKDEEYFYLMLDDEMKWYIVFSKMKGGHCNV